MAPAAVARHRLETVEDWTDTLCRVATPRRRPGAGGTHRRLPTWPLAPRAQPCSPHRHADNLLQITRTTFPRKSGYRIIQRTAVYGTRTYGGVGGEEPRGSPLSRLLDFDRPQDVDARN